MIKSEVINKVSHMSNISNKNIVESIVNSFISNFIKKMREKEIEIKNFGTFLYVKTKGRPFTNPITGELHNIEDYYFPKFRLNKNLQNFFNDEDEFIRPLCSEYLVFEISNELKIKPVFVEKIINNFLTTLVIGIKTEDRVYVSGFATFKKIIVPGRVINHFSGKKVIIEPYYKVKFIPSKNMKYDLKIRGDTK